MALKGTGHARVWDDWKCRICHSWHRHNTLQCRKCGHIPMMRNSRSKYNETRLAAIDYYTRKRNGIE